MITAEEIEYLFQSKKSKKYSFIEKEKAVEKIDIWHSIGSYVYEHKNLWNLTFLVEFCDKLIYPQLNRKYEYTSVQWQERSRSLRNIWMR